MEIIIYHLNLQMCHYLSAFNQIMRDASSERLESCLQNIFDSFMMMLKLWRYLNASCGFWFTDEKSTTNHQISHKLSPSLCSHLVCHIILKYYSLLTHSALCLPLEKTWSGLFTATIHWINLTSPQVWPSDKIQAFPPRAASFLQFKRLNSSFCSIF